MQAAAENSFARVLNPLGGDQEIQKNENYAVSVILVYINRPQDFSSKFWVRPMQLATVIFQFVFTVNASAVGNRL